MARNQEPLQILLVNPPLAGPAAPPRGLARAAGLLRGLGLAVEVWEASLDFWRQELLGPQRPEAASALAVLRGQAFFEPEHYLAAQQEIARLLQESSAQWAPAVFTWQGLAHPAAGSLAQAVAWANNSGANPLYQFSEQGLSTRLDRGRVLLVLNLAAPGQWLGALTLAAAAKRLHPQVQVALLGSDLPPPGAIGPGYALWEHRLGGPGDLGELAAGLAGREPVAAPAEPDFSGLPRAAYFSPLTVYALGPRRWAEREADRADLAALAQAGARLVRWRLEPEGREDPAARLVLVRQALRAGAAAGLWNHLELPEAADSALREGLLRLAGVNPHLTHSWSHPPRWPWSPGPAGPRPQPQAGGYSRLAPLPGRPLWQALAEPAHLRLYLDRHGRGPVRRWWVRPEGRSVYALGGNVTYHFHPPAEIPPQRLEELVQLILAGGKVGSKWLRHNLGRAYVVGWAEEEGVLVGTDTLKRPRPEYLASIKAQSGMDLSGHAERGYISIRPQYRGLGVGSQLIKHLVARAGGLKMFVIVGRDNPGGEQILRRNQTRLVATYYSQKLGKEMGIWMPVDQEPPSREAVP